MSNSTKRAEGLRPPPTKRPSSSALSILFVMILVIISAFIASGGLSPVDPNGPGGPPTVEPYYNSSNYPPQHIITPTGVQSGAKNNLQLQTFQVDNCGQNAAILFVIDTSGSMSYAGKMDNAKHALTYFMNHIGGKEVIGIDTFSKDVNTKIILNYYKDVSQQVTDVIKNLSPDGWTRTRDAMQLAYDQLNTAITQQYFPGYQYNLILMTDGVPEIPDANRTCEVTVPDPNLTGGIRCFAKEQDPRYPYDITNEIKNLGVDVYTINVYSPSYRSDFLLHKYLQDLLIEMASSPTSTHYYESTNGSNLSDLLQNINHNICYKNFN